MLTVSVCDFGVLPYVAEDQTEGIQAAIDHVFKMGGGEVTVPEGVYNITTIRIRSNVRFHLLERAVLMASRDPEAYFRLKYDTVEPVAEDQLDEAKWERINGVPNNFHVMGGRWHNGIIRMLDGENIELIGEEGSVIDGRNSFDEKGEEHYRGVHGISVLNCKNVLLKGYTVKDSGNWANMLQNCTDVTADGIKCVAGHDGIHFTTCDNLTVKNCEFYTGDDCVAGFDLSNLTVESCILNSACSAFRLGGRDITIKNCKAFAPAKYMFRYPLSDEEKRAGIPSNESKSVVKRNNMLSFFTYYASYLVEIRHAPGNIRIENCVIEGADKLLHYNLSGNEMWQCNRPLDDISFTNIEATGMCRPTVAYAKADHHCRLTIENAKLSFKADSDAAELLHLANLSEFTMKNVEVSGGIDRLAYTWDSGAANVTLDNVTGCDNSLVQAEAKFTAKPI